MSFNFSAARSTRQRGFTLIELVVVIVILGILAAFAIPRFINIAQSARTSSLNGLAGTLRSTSALVHGMALAKNVVNDSPSTGKISLEGTNIDIVNSYPAATANGIQAALNNTSGFTITSPAAGQMLFQVTGAAGTGATDCSVLYTEAGAGTSAVVGQPTNTNNC